MAIKATFFLPERDNDGRDLTSEINAVQEECFVAFGGWTLMGYFKGVWRMESGAQQTDVSAVYMVILEDVDLPLLEAILKRFKAKTTQEAIFLEVVQNVDIRFL